MGGSFDYRIYKHNDRKKIKKHFEGECEQAKYEDGTSYPGTIAAMNTVNDWRDKQFTTDGEAQEFMVNEHDKWDEGMAVSYLLPKAPTERDKKRVEKANAKVLAAIGKLNEANAKVRADFAKAKSKMVGCKGCGSKMSREHLATLLRSRAIKCPLCAGDLLNATWRKRQAKLTEVIEKAREALNEASVPKTNGQIGWIVGGWCSS